VWFWANRPSPPRRQINVFLSFVNSQRPNAGHAFGNMVNINSCWM
jgi:hypothetical protein